ncbi:aminodeoxychorismate synthase component I [Paenibacillus allorhizosphaerae]|uniref:Isochorismate synthase MenF n=1 Tax=Paenibacillus allorhizosphaerae TaxID=2849866 RepID=A0ABM8VCX8_9BACL|nr:aminodeoxychorismate synthase component I [Paenibacillus allorhizosphaerae]CAG7625405.1 Isochorismate synthase MenF [Paenibacillus allorhizosphaerae]
MNANPLLVFDFHGNRKIFTSPIAVYCTYDLSEVQSIFDKVQEAINANYFVAGYISYEAASAFSHHYRVKEGTHLPLVWFAVFENPASSHELKESHYQLSRWKSTTSRQQYNQAMKRIKRFISNGETYQVNYTVRLKSSFQGDPYTFYQYLRSVQKASYCAYLHLGQYSILSASPELFFHWDGDNITTKPMKGTSRRGETGEEDRRLEQSLFLSEKDRAENVMIVDLLRNDLSKIAKVGTVKVPALFEIETYPTLFQMTSTVKAITKEGLCLYDIFEALFPCGSITGAPKIRTTAIISDLEQSPREVYCGAIGLIEPGNIATFNVAIRTVIVDSVSGTAEYGVGGGITWGSSDTDEYNEVLTKAKVVTEAMKRKNEASTER